jgi:membrane glycosyltransferase
VFSSRSTTGAASKRAKLFLIPEEYDPPKELVDTDRYVEVNRERALKDGFMHAVFDPSFNALASALATSRHLKSDVLEFARDRQVDQALSESPAKLDRDRRLALISDPVTLSRMHYRLWAHADKYHDWFDYYKSLKMNPQALQNTKPETV